MALVNRLLFFFLIGFSIAAQSQARIDLKIDNQLISDLLIDVATHFKKDITFNESYFTAQTISVHKNNLSLSAALHHILEDQDVEYKITATGIEIQKHIQLYGYVIDKDSREKLIGAHVIENKYGKGSWTNEEGFFSMKVPAETRQLSSSYIGYNDGTLNLSITKDTYTRPLLLELSTSESLDLVTISSSPPTVTPINLLRGHDILKTEIKTLVATGGEPDIMQYLYSQAGVTTGPDGIGGLHVRGGLVDQNLYLLDGITVYNPSHSFGLHSIFNTNMIQVAEFKKSGFTASESGRTASILDLRMIDGDMQKWNSDISISTLATGLLINGPLIKDKASLVIGARRTHIDPAIKTFTRNNKADKFIIGQTTFNFYDLYGKLNLKLSSSDKLIFSAYKGRDNYQDEADDTYYIFDEADYEIGYDSDYYYSEFDWGNDLLSIKWNHIYGNKLFSTTTVGYSKFEFYSYSYYDNILEFYEPEAFTQNFQVSNFLSSISDISIGHKFEYYPNANHHYTLGLNASQKLYSPGIFNLEYGTVEEWDQVYFEDYFEDELDNYYKSEDYTLSINDQISLGEMSALNLGINTSYYRSEDLLFGDEASFLLWQANLKFTRLINKQFSIQLALDKMYQPLHVVSTSSIGFPNDLWVPSTNIARPQSSYQADLGISFTHKATHIQLNAYLKQQDNILRYNENPNLPSILEIRSQLWETESAIGSGTAMGIELSCSHSTDNFKSMINYAYADPKRQFDDINNGAPFPFAFNLKHTLSANFLFKIKNNLWTYANWNYRSGLHQTLYESNYLYTAIQNHFDDELTQISNTNADVEKPYHRLDLGIKWSHKTETTKQHLTLGIQNIYNQHNNYFSYIIVDDQFPELNGRESKKALPLIPTINYRIGF